MPQSDYTSDVTFLWFFLFLVEICHPLVQVKVRTHSLHLAVRFQWCQHKFSDVLKITKYFEFFFVNMNTVWRLKCRWVLLTEELPALSCCDSRSFNCTHLDSTSYRVMFVSPSVGADYTHCSVRLGNNAVKRYQVLHWDGCNEEMKFQWCFDCTFLFEDPV